MDFDLQKTDLAGYSLIAVLHLPLCLGLVAMTFPVIGSGLQP
jgi:hypothetical protein